MNDSPIQLIVAAFQDEFAADEALKKLKTAQKQNLIEMQDAAVIRRDEKNKLHIKETADPGGGRGAAAGGAIGAVIGLIAGPPGLQPGCSAIVAIIEHNWVEGVEKQLAEAGADVLTEQLRVDIAEQLQTGREESSTAKTAKQGSTSKQVIAGEE